MAEIRKVAVVGAAAERAAEDGPGADPVTFS